MLGTFTPAPDPKPASQPGAARPEGWQDHWPAPPTDATAAQLYDWMLRHRATDAINHQTDAMEGMTDAQKDLQDIQRQVLEELRKPPPTPTGDSREDLIFRTLDAAKDFIQRA